MEKKTVFSDSVLTQVVLYTKLMSPSCLILKAFYVILLHFSIIVFVYIAELHNSIFTFCFSLRYLLYYKVNSIIFY